MLLADIGIEPNGLNGDDKIKFNDWDATLGEAGAIVEGTACGNCGGSSLKNCMGGVDTSMGVDLGAGLCNCRGNSLAAGLSNCGGASLGLVLVVLKRFDLMKYYLYFDLMPYLMFYLIHSFFPLLYPK